MWRTEDRLAVGSVEKATISDCVTLVINHAVGQRLLEFRDLFLAGLRVVEGKHFKALQIRQRSQVADRVAKTLEYLRESSYISSSGCSEARRQERKEATASSSVEEVDDDG